MFEDLKVIELASVLAGPLAGSFFAELGAKVIKIENKRQGGDVTRKWRLPEENPDNDISAYYASANYGKEVIMADLSDAQDRKMVLKLIESCDVLISNFKSGSAVKLGLDYESLKAVNPKLIYASLTGYGKDNPRPAYDLVLQAETGFMSMTGEENGSPCKIPVAMIDIMAAHHLKEAILCAYIKLLKSDEGSHIEISLVDAAIASLINQASNYLMTGKLAKPMGSRHPNIAPYGDSFRCSDGRFLLLAIGSDKQFDAFCNIAKISTKGYETNTLRLEKRSQLNILIEDEVKNHKLSFWLDKLGEAGIPHAKISNLSDVFDKNRQSERILESIIGNTLTSRPKTAYI